jgi:4-carboxymuconolactone decarboxylase
MAITETAQKNHEELFPGHQSKLAATDPEFVELFDNYAFDEVLGYGELDLRTRMMAILASLIAQQALGEYRVMLGAALNAGVTPVEAKEILYQAVAYVGIAKAFDFLHATNEVLEARGVKLPIPGQSTTTPADRFEKGRALAKSIFGERIDRMVAEAPPGQAHIQRLISAHAFGDYYSRTGLDIQMRELITFALLLSLGGCEPQLKAHIEGNAAVGNGKQRLVTVLTHLLPFVGFPRTLNALRCINESLPDPQP